jgi:cytochrome c2
MKISDLLLFILLLLLSGIPESSSGQSKDLPSDRESIDNGETLFLNNCNVCHALSIERIGPALSTVTKKRPLPWLLGFIKNSQSMI